MASATFVAVLVLTSVAHAATATLSILALLESEMVPCYLLGSYCSTQYL